MTSAPRRARPAWIASAILTAAACSRSQGIPDEQLGNLVIEPPPPPPIAVDRAAKDRAELTRALRQPHGALVAALGPHTVTVASGTTVTEAGSAGKEVSKLTDTATIELAEPGERGAFHAVYTNSADHGRETTFTGGKLYLRPRYQRWHARAPEAPDEPAALRDAYFAAVAATWDLVGFAAELSDRGPAEVAGRAGRRIEIRRAPSPGAPPREELAQRQWRTGRVVEALAGEVVLDADHGVPLAAKLAGTVAFTRDGRRFAMAVTLDAEVTALGPVAVAAPDDKQVVATPERLREVDDRDYLLHNIAPPIRRNPDGTPAPPSPRTVQEPK